MKHNFHGLRRILESLYHRVWWLIRGITGADRREKQRLMRQLNALKAEYNVLNRELGAVRQHLGLENRSLKTLYNQAQAERDDLQLEIWELEDIIEELFDLLTAVRTAELQPESISTLDKISQADAVVHHQPTVPNGERTIDNSSTKLEAVDLSDIKLALVGGHGSTRREVIDELSTGYGLAQWVELPPFSKHSLGRSNIKAKLQDCDLIVLITGYMKHKQTDSIMQLRKLGALSGDVLLLNCRGKSGVVREILTYISQKNC